MEEKDFVIDDILQKPEFGEEIPVEYAGFWIRVGAAFLDGLILLIPSLGINMLIGGGIMEQNFIATFITSLLYLGYKIGMEANSGATLGKRAVGIKVVKENGEKAEAKDVMLRNVFTVANTSLTLVGVIVPMLFITRVSSLVSLVFGISCIIVAFDSKKQGLHDKIGKTIVVRD